MRFTLYGYWVAPFWTGVAQNRIIGELLDCNSPLAQGESLRIRVTRLHIGAAEGDVGR